MSIVIVNLNSEDNLPILHNHGTLAQPQYAALNDKRYLISKIYDLIIALFREISFVLNYRKAGSKLEKTSNIKFFWKPDDKDITKWNADAKGAVFFIHGLRGEPRIWTDHIKQIDKNLDQRAFHIPHQGNCPDEQAIGDIVKVIKNYAESFPNKPIVIFGLSNGARLLLHIDDKLQNINNPIYFMSIAGPHYGTKVMNMAAKICCCIRHHPKLEERLLFGNPIAVDLLNKIRARPVNPNRQYDFYASESDQTIRSAFFDNIHLCALPIIKKNESHILVKGHRKAGHNAIVAHVRDLQITRMKQWLKNLQAVLN